MTGTCDRSRCHWWRFRGGCCPTCPLSIPCSPYTSFLSNASASHPSSFLPSYLPFRCPSRRTQLEGLAWQGCKLPAICFCWTSSPGLKVGKATIMLMNGVYIHVWRPKLEANKLSVKFTSLCNWQLFADDCSCGSGSGSMAGWTDVSACNSMSNGRFGLHLGNGCRSAVCIDEVADNRRTLNRMITTHTTPRNYAMFRIVHRIHITI